MNNYQNPFKTLTRFEYALWIGSMLAVTLSFALSTERDLLTWFATLVGVTALIFMSKGDVFGQALIVVFSILYAIISIKQQYYGEAITYMGMSAPIAAIAVVSWLRHPSGKGHNEVAVAHVKPLAWCIVTLLSLVVTVIFYFILGALGTANLIPSTVSVTTSFFAASLTFLRSPYYGLGYAANDVVLIVLWVMAAFEDPSTLPMVLCFVTFLANDIYGFLNWKRMRKKQEA